VAREIHWHLCKFTPKSNFLSWKIPKDLRKLTQGRPAPFFHAMTTTPVSLLERVAQNQAGPDWNKFVAIYQPLLRSWLFPQVPQFADVEDLIQDILTLLVTKLPEFRHTGQPGAFRAWLRQIVAYRLKNFWRQQQRSARADFPNDLEQFADALEDPAHELSRRWEEEHDRHIVTKLLTEIRSEFSAMTWEMFDRSVLQGLSPAQVAAELNVTRNAVFIARSRILRRLREEAGVLLDQEDAGSWSSGPQK
jgi:RNA polymerase sigma factor (sigma-70 family)